MINVFLSSKTKKKETIMKQVREYVDYSGERKGKPYTFINNFSFFDCQLPSIVNMQPGLRDLYIKSVIDEDMKSDLEDSSSINWCPQAMKVLPVCVPRDGNCLLHAASVAVWGVEDSKKTLRELMLMTIKINHNFKTRWKYQLEKDLQSIDISQTEVVDQEWNDVIRSISDLGSNTLSVAVPHRFLESVHIYILANILRRPIIILTSGHAKSLAGHDLQENHIGGLYLPLEWTPLECCKTPLVLGYSFNHFCPLLSEDTQTSPQGKKSSLMFPLVHNDFSSLLVRFLKKEEDSRAWDLVQSYLLVKEVDIVLKNTVCKVPLVLMSLKPLQPEQNSLFEHFELLEERKMEAEYLKASKFNLHSIEGATQKSNHPFYDIEMKSQTEVVPVRTEMLKHLVNQNNPHKCISDGCTKQGLDFLDNFCPDCFRILAAAKSTATSKTKMKNTTSSENQNIIEVSSEAILDKNEVQVLIPTAPLISLEPPEQDVVLLSMMTERCINHCGYRCSNRTYPYCHECYQLNLEKAKQNYTTVASLSSQNSIVTEINSSFVNKATENPLNLENPQLLEKENDNFESQLVSEIEIKSNQNTQNLEDILEKFTHMKSSYQNIQTEPFLSKQHGGSEAIVQYVEQIANTNPAEGNNLSFAETDIINSMTGDIEVSEEPSCKVSCAYCQTLFFPPDKLCSKCRDILDRNYEKSQKSTKNSQKASIKHQPEKEKLNNIEIGKPPLNAKQSDVRKIETQLETQGVSSKNTHKGSSLLKTLKGKPCITPKCPNYGDPQMDDKCSQCYFKFSPSAKPQTNWLETSKKDRKTPGSPMSGGTEKPLIKDSNLSGAFSQQKEIKSPYEASITSPVHTKHTSGTIHAPHQHYQASSNAAAAYATLPPFQQFDLESYLSFPDPKSVIVTSKTGQNIYESFCTLPPNSTYSFSQERDESTERQFQGIERLIKASNKKCLFATCENYGNKDKEGYCNACFKVIRRQRVLEREAQFGISVPDNPVLEGK